MKTRLFFLHKYAYSYNVGVCIPKYGDTKDCYGQLEAPKLIANFDGASAEAFPKLVILSDPWLSVWISRAPPPEDS